ncbi:MAG TPA: polyprenyl diphosphate synthase, partial [Microlunatus sp.]
GNRRWARRKGLVNAGIGHQYGAEHLQDLLGWCEKLEIDHVTVFVCSTENILRRATSEVDFLMDVIESMARSLLRQRARSWRVRIAGNLDVLPDRTARALKNLVDETADDRSGRQLVLAIGYGGRQEIFDAFTDYLHEQQAAGSTLSELARRFDLSDIDRHLYVDPMPSPDLIIRTSGEQRSSNFLLWQGIRANYYFCDVYWPAFREFDFLRAVRSFSAAPR